MMDLNKAADTAIQHVEKLDKLPVPKVTGDALLINPDGSVQKLPIPSSDPNDPLNFSTWEKTGIVVSCCWFSIMSLALSGGLGAILVTFIDMYAPEHSSTQVLWLTTFPSLFIGIGTSSYFPCLLLSSLRISSSLTGTRANLSRQLVHPAPIPGFW
jgi:hypothetical protein